MSRRLSLVTHHSSLLSTPRLDRRNARGALRAVGGRERGNVEGGERDAGDAYVGAPAGAVNDRGRADDERARRAHCLDGLARRAAGRDHVLDDENLLAGPDGEASPQSHAPFFALSPDRADAERPRDLPADDDAADCRRDDRLDVLAAEALSDGATERLGLRRVLQHERALEVLRAVQAARQNEVAFEQRARPPEPFDDLFLPHASAFPFPRDAATMRPDADLPQPRARLGPRRRDDPDASHERRARAGDRSRRNSPRTPRPR